ncbi:hypothetical protein QSI_0367 [Clostridioides difficile P28]|nr:hypothetical protein QSI_0367 [Clostridioides difficile P28]
MPAQIGSALIPWHFHLYTLQHEGLFFVLFSPVSFYSG